MDTTKDLSQQIGQWLNELEQSKKESITKEKTAQDASSNKAGTIAIFDGKLFMEKPERGGKWPTISPDIDGLVKIYNHGKLVEKALVLEDVKGIELQVLQQPSKSSFEIVVSPDKLEVWLVTEFTLGSKYEISDSDYTSDLVVSAKEIKRLKAQPIDVTKVLSEITEKGIKVELKHDEIMRACTAGINGKYLIGMGMPSKPPIDGRIESEYNLFGKSVFDEVDDQRTWVEKQKVDSVEPGEVIAEWYPPVEGEPGMDVFGEPIAPRLARWDRFLVGSGARLVEDGRVAIAENAGRPCLEMGLICVKPELIIYSDVEVATGNVEFTGDVIINGDVKESSMVDVGGRVDVRGGVYHAQIKAGNHLTIDRNLIGGHVIVGGELTNGIEIVALLKQILPQLERLQSIFIQLQTHHRFSTKDLQNRGDGYLIKLILETRIADIPKLFEKLNALLPKEDELDTENALDKIWFILHRISTLYLGAGPLNIKSIADVNVSISALKRIDAFLQDVVCIPANIRVEYCQNATLEASGDIVVFGPLVYSCTMTAGGNIRIAGSCRGGQYFASTSITIKSAGLNETVKTYLATSENGTIKAETFYPGVQLNIGQGKKLITKVRDNVQFSFQNGEWLEREWK